MALNKLVAGTSASDPLASTGADVAAVVNGLVGVKQQQTVVLFGDSYAESQTMPPSGNTTSFSLYRFILGKLGGGASVVRNAGISGNTFEQMLARITTDVLPYESEWVFLNGGVNDVFGYDKTANRTFLDAKAVLDTLLADGRKVLMFNCPPQVSTRSGFSSAKSTECAKYNNLIANYVEGLNGVLLVDLYSAFVNWGDTTNGGAVSDYFAGDGIHLSTLGEIVAANLAVEKLSGKFTQDLSILNSPLDSGIAGNEGLFIGTTGANGTGSSGSVATAYTSSRVSGAGTIVCSKLPFRGQRQTVTLGAANGECRTRLTNSLLTELTPFIGKTVSTKILFRLRTTSGGVSLKDVLLKLTTTDGTTLWQAVNGGANGGYAPITDTQFDTGLCLIELRPLFINTGLTSATGLYFELLLDSVSGGTVEFDVYAVDIREVA